MGQSLSFAVEDHRSDYYIASFLRERLSASIARCRPSYAQKDATRRVRSLIGSLPQLLADVAYLDAHVAPLFVDATGMRWRFDVAARVPPKALLQMAGNEEGMTDDGDCWARCNNVVVAARRVPASAPADVPAFEPMLSPATASAAAATATAAAAATNAPAGAKDSDISRGLSAVKVFLSDVKAAVAPALLGVSVSATEPGLPHALRPAEFYSLFLYMLDQSVHVSGAGAGTGTAAHTEADAAAAAAAGVGTVRPASAPAPGSARMTVPALAAAPPPPTADPASPVPGGSGARGLGTGAGPEACADSACGEAASIEARAAGSILGACLGPAVHSTGAVPRAVAAPKPYQAEEEEEGAEELCAVCFDRKVAKVLPCSHAFCEKCLDGWYVCCCFFFVELPLLPTSLT
jgi:hypothetical protein